MSIFLKMTAKRNGQNKATLLNTNPVYTARDFFTDNNQELGVVSKETFTSYVKSLFDLGDVKSWEGLIAMFNYLSYGKRIYVQEAPDRMKRSCFFIKEDPFSPFAAVKVVNFEGLQKFISMSIQYKIQITLEQLCEEAEK